MRALSTSSISSSTDDLAIDNALDIYIKKRKEELQNEFNAQRKALEENRGKLIKVEEAVFLDNLRQFKVVVCHFYHPEFNACKTMNNLLETLAPIHSEIKFIKVDALGAGFFVNKLKIKTLPTLCIFENGILKKKFLGFEGLGDDTPSIKSLQSALVREGIIECSLEAPKATTILGHKEREDSDSF